MKSDMQVSVSTTKNGHSFQVIYKGRTVRCGVAKSAAAAYRSAHRQGVHYLSTRHHLVTV